MPGAGRPYYPDFCYRGAEDQDLLFATALVVFSQQFGGVVFLSLAQVLLVRACEKAWYAPQMIIKTLALSYSVTSWALKRT